MGALFDTRYYRVTKLFCSAVGLWPYQAQLRKKIIQAINLIILFSYFPPQLRKLYKVWGKDIDAVCMCITPIFAIIVCLAKNATIIRFDAEMKMLLRQIELNWEITTKEGEYKILVNYTSKARIWCIVYSTMMCNLLVCFIMTPMISPVLDIVLPRNETRVRNLVFDLDYGIDPQTYWTWIWLHNCMTSGVTVFNLVSADLIYVTLIVYGSCLFAITRHKLEHVTDAIKPYALPSREKLQRNYNVEYNVFKYEDCRLKSEKQAIGIKECIISHVKAIRCARLLHYIYTWSLFIILGLNLLGISISGIQVVSKLSQWTEAMTSVLFITGELMHLFFLCLMAQFILDQSSNVHKSAYSCFWYNMPIDIRKGIIIILMRSRVPCTIKAGKLFIMSLENFCSILQTSMSYFTVLASFR